MPGSRANLPFTCANLPCVCAKFDAYTGSAVCASDAEKQATLVTCRRCRKQFDPAQNGPRACRFHPNHYGGAHPVTAYMSFLTTYVSFCIACISPLVAYVSPISACIPSRSLRRCASQFCVRTKSLAIYLVDKPTKTANNCILKRQMA